MYRSRQITFQGDGGRTVDKLSKFDSHLVRRLQPQVANLEISSCNLSPLDAHWNHITISTVHHVIPYKYKALLSRHIIVVRIFNFAVADDVQHGDADAGGARNASKRLNTEEEGESSTTGTNCNTDGTICYIIVFVE